MRASNVGPTLLLLASAVVAQTTEGVFTIQTSVPSPGTATCYEVCIKEPCYACSAADQMTLPVVSLPPPSGSGQMTVPAVSLPSPIDTIVPPVSLPSPIDTIVPPVSLPSPIETSVVVPRPSPSSRSITTTTEGMMSIPAGETPESTGVATTASSQRPTASSTTSGPAQASTAAAALPLNRDGTQYLLAVGVSGMSVLLGAAWALF